VTGSAVTSAFGAAAGTTVTGTVDCPTGKLLLGGGATATTNQTGNASRFALQTSAPVDADTWRGIAVVTTTLSGGQTVTICPSAICTT
jgi:hypothetical protein